MNPLPELSMRDASWLHLISRIDDPRVHIRISKMKRMCGHVDLLDIVGTLDDDDVRQASLFILGERTGSEISDRAHGFVTTVRSWRQDQEGR